MIVAGFLLLAIGAVDLVRQFVLRHWIGYLATGIVLVVVGTVGDALLPAFAAMVAAALWVWTMPDEKTPVENVPDEDVSDEKRPKAAFWPAAALAVIVIGAVLWLSDRGAVGLLAEVWRVDSPIGPVTFDLAVLSLGSVVFLLESGNLIVRAALDRESAARPTNSFQGGRLIGPLERVLVFALTLVGAYPLLAAMLAAKGIVRFPEISRGGENGARAEYFLVGSLVSWVVALGAAFLVWWCALS